MGCYDTIKYICPFCGRESLSQTKLSKCDCVVLQIGDTFKFTDAKIKLKEPCRCGKFTVMIIKNEKIVGFQKSNPDIVEYSFGEYDKKMRKEGEALLSQLKSKG